MIFPEFDEPHSVFTAEKGQKLTVSRSETIVFKSLARDKLTGTIEEIQTTLNLVLLSKKGIAV